VVRTTVWLLFAAWFIDYADRLAINYVLPSIGDEFDLDYGRQGLVVSVFFFAYALCQIPGGILADRFGARQVTCWALLAWSLFTGLTGLAWSFAVLLVVRFAFGAAEGIFPSASMKVLVERTSTEERMSANGLIMSATALAAVVAPLAVAPAADVYGWRPVFLTTAVIGTLVYAAVHRWLPPARRLPAGATPETGLRQARRILRVGVLWRFSAMMAGYSTIIWGLNTWVPTYLKEVRGISLTSAGLVMALPAVGAVIATVLGGRLADHLRGQHRIVIVPAMSVAALGLVALACVPSLIGAAISGTIAIFCASLCYMPILAVPLRSLAAEHVGVASAVIVLGGQLAGMITPTVLGLLADAFSFEVAFAFLALGAALTILMAVLTPQDTPSFLARAPGLAPRGDTPAPAEMETP
jgi:predicted MFS family arabinose efflux permease